ncbi:sigma-70 family RNA polymerase sigma factor [Streptomyces sp. NPDC057540]|uniref:sigma-70 family RNA polymerase sigma factor n=1 Tax=Streptomyces sp. NPDC057540 TaxID=3346160 RepID=UPI0036C5929B
MSEVGTEESGTVGLPPRPLPPSGQLSGLDPGYWEFHTANYDNFLRYASYDLRSEELAEAAIDATFHEVMGQWPRIKNMEKPTAYAMTVLKKRIIDQGRKRARTSIPVEEAVLWDLLHERTGRNDPLAAVAEKIALYSAVGRLPERQRDVITLYYLLDQPSQVVAQMLGIDQGTVRSHIKRALPRLARAMDMPIERTGHGKAGA